MTRARVALPLLLWACAGFVPAHAHELSPGGQPPPIASDAPATGASASKGALRAAGGAGILFASEKATLVVVGTVSSLRKVDASGWAASVKVDAVYVGEAEKGSTVEIAWEELASTRQVRFEQGQRLLLVLEPLPAQSLWKKRFPAGAGEKRVLAVANRGEAFLRAPDPASLHLLEHYLLMKGDARRGAPGAHRLVDLVVSADQALARDALSSLEGREDLAVQLGEGGSAMLLRVAMSTSRSRDIRARCLALAASRSLPGARAAAEALAEPGSTLRPEALRVLARMEPGIEPAKAAALLGDSDPEVRVVGIALSSGADSRAKLLEMSRSDSDPRVRLAAGGTLLAREGAAAIPDAIGLLRDTDPSVRSGIAKALGTLGEPAVEPLRKVVEEGPDEASLAAVLGLAKAGPAGAKVIEALGESSTNEKVRTAARLVRGKGPPKHGHTHE